MDEEEWRYEPPRDCAVVWGIGEERTYVGSAISSYEEPGVVIHSPDGHITIIPSRYVGMLVSEAVRAALTSGWLFKNLGKESAA